MFSIAQFTEARAHCRSHQHLHPLEDAGVAALGSVSSPQVCGLQAPPVFPLSSTYPPNERNSFIRTFQKKKPDGYLEIWHLRENLFVKFGPGPNEITQASRAEWEQQDTNGPVCLLPRDKCVFVVSCGTVVWPWTDWDEWIKGQFLAIQRCPGSSPQHHKANPYLDFQYVNIRTTAVLEERPIKRPGVIINHAIECPVLEQAQPWLARTLRVYDAVVRKCVPPSGLQALSLPQVQIDDGREMAQLPTPVEQLQPPPTIVPEPFIEFDPNFGFIGGLSPDTASSQGSGDTNDLFDLDGLINSAQMLGDTEMDLNLGSGDGASSSDSVLGYSTSSPSIGLSPVDTLLQEPGDQMIGPLLPELSQIALAGLQTQVVQTLAAAAILQPNDYDHFRRWLANIVAL